jgi:hypothetical protein
LPLPIFFDGSGFAFSPVSVKVSGPGDAGVDDQDIQSILRHADISTTQAFYISAHHERAKAELKKLDKTLRTKYGIKA